MPRESAQCHKKCGGVRGFLRGVKESFSLLGHALPLVELLLPAEVLHGVYSTGHAALDAGMAGLAVVTEPCLRLAEPAETAMDAAVGVDA